MSAFRIAAVSLACAALLLGAGCGGSGNAVTGEETNDPLYQQAQDYKKQGRYNEALNAFLKEIDRRGENGAPESHLEAGALYLNWSHNPVEAYHHFSKYLELQPTGPRAAVVRGQRDAAMRDIARYLLAPANNQAITADRNDDVDALRRKIDELTAENQTLRGAAGMPLPRSSPIIALPQPNATDTAASDTEITPVTTPPASSNFTHNLPAPALPSNGGRATSSTSAAAPSRVPAIGPGGTGERVATTPTRPGTPQRPAASPAGSRRSHTVTAGEKSLWGIARQVYGSSVNQSRVNAIYEANRDVMHNPNDLRPGMVLRIP